MGHPAAPGLDGVRGLLSLPAPGPLHDTHPWPFLVDSHFHWYIHQSFVIRQPQNRIGLPQHTFVFKSMCLQDKLGVSDLK